MVFGLAFAKADNILRLTLSGEMTDQSVMELWSKGEPLVASYASCRSIVDMSDVSGFQVSNRAITTLAKKQSADGPMRVLVAPQEVICGTARMFLMLSGGTHRNIQFVRTMEEAYKVLGVESPDFVEITP